MSGVYFTSDPHIGHDNVLEFGNRGFDTMHDMEVAYVSDWNSVISKRDIVFVLGDVAWKVKDLEIFGHLNGTKRLVLGNHDKFHYSEYAKYFEEIKGARGYKGCILTHIPIHPQEFYRWKYNIHGHLHGNRIDDPRYINVNVDTTRTFKPIKFDELISQHESYIA